MVTLLKPPKEVVSSMMCVVISGPSLNEARQQVHRSRSRADILEFRLDQFSFFNIDAIAHLKDASTIPVVFTLRKRSHGGEYTGDEQQRLEQIRQLLVLKPAYLDLEYDVTKSFYEEISKNFPDIEIICSYHDLRETPKDLQIVFEVMKQCPASIYKIATMGNSTIDGMRILKFTRENVKKGCRIAAMCMGEYGAVTRILGTIFGSAILYTPLSLDQATAPGQLTFDELVGRYQLKKHTKETMLFGLIGNPISRSPSHQTHNYVFKALGINAVYVKFNIQPQELHEFLDIAKKINMKGISVTMPLKEFILDELSEDSEDSINIGAINTLLFENKKIKGINTDGIGALDAIEELVSVADKIVVILGAGGAAKAIAWETKKRGAKIIILNRTVEKAEELAKHLNCQYGALSDFPLIASKGYDVLVNGTSIGLFLERARLPVDCSYLLEGKVVLDIIPSNSETPFLLEAKKKQCSIILGNKMLMYQAIEQFNFWFGDSVTKESIVKAFQEAFKLIQS